MKCFHLWQLLLNSYVYIIITEGTYADEEIKHSNYPNKFIAHCILLCYKSMIDFSVRTPDEFVKLRARANLCLFSPLIL